MIEAFLFDLDDTLAATAPIWRGAEEHLLRAVGAAWSAELAAKYKGMNALDLAAVVHRELQPAMSVAGCQQILRDQLLANFRRGPIEDIDGAVDLVQRCAKIGVPMAVASGSPMEAIELALESLGIRDRFAMVLSSEQVERGKPHPAVYIATAEQLNGQPENCLVFEDSLIGVQSADAAGMRCVVRPSLPNDAITAVATWVVDRWQDVDLASIIDTLDE